MGYFADGLLHQFQAMIVIWFVSVRESQKQPAKCMIPGA